MDKNYKHNYAYNEVNSFTDFKEMILKTTERNQDKIAFKFTRNKQDLSVTFKEHCDNMFSFGTALCNEGIHGKHIAMVSENSYEWILTQITVLGSDNVYVPVDKELPLNDLLNVLNHSDTEYVVCSNSFAKCFNENIDKLPNVKKFFVFFKDGEYPENFVDAYEFIEEGRMLLHAGDTAYASTVCDENALAELVYTSGTTGAPKGVMLTRHNLSSCVYYAIRVMNVYEVGISVLPYNHTYESTCDLLVHQHLGVTLCINENLKTVASNLKKYHPTHAMLVPLFVETFYKTIWKTLNKTGKADMVKTMIKVSNALRKVGIDLRRVFFKQILEVFGGEFKEIICGGAPLRPELAEFFDAIGIKFINGYGITECSPLLSVNRFYYNDWHSVGVTLECVQVRIEDPNEAGEGEIVVKGDIVMKGYYKNEEATKEVMTEDGWFSTGDYGKLVGDRLFITGRKKNLIVLKNGKNIYPEEIEDYVSGIEGVEEAIVYSNIDENGDEVSLCAEIYPSPDFSEGKTAEELAKYFKSKCTEVCRPLPGYKQIYNVVLRDEEFPKTTTRKIKRQEVLKLRRQ